jgi:hypothetical protein
MRALPLLIALLSGFLMAGQDSCAVFEVPTPAIKMMGYMPDPPSWKNVNYVVHVHYTDSFPYQYSYLGDTIIWDAHEHLNEEFEEALFSFDLLAIEYHNLDEVEGMQEALALYNTCVPYSYYGWTEVENYLEDIVWDRSLYMNVHVFPQFCAGILGFAWTAQATTPFDGVWVRTNVFGRIGDHLWGSRDENKTLIHEVGHYLSLHHVFRNVEYCGEDLGPCEETGDYVCDTPPIKVSWSCENPICPPGLYNYTPDNHMDYYVDSCRQHFTDGQIERMHTMIPITRPGLVNNDANVCVGDLNGDYVVGMNDMLLMLANWNDLYWEQGDVNGDGFFTVTDFQIVLAQWGTICFGAELDPFYREEQTNTSIIRKVFPNAVRGE